MPDTQNTLLNWPQSLITAWGTSSRNLVHRSMGPIWQVAKILARESRVWFFLLFKLIFVLCYGPCAAKEKWHRKEHIIIIIIRSQRQLVLCRSDVTISALLSEAVFDRCAPRMRYHTCEPAGHSWRSFPLHTYVWTDSMDHASGQHGRVSLTVVEELYVFGFFASFL